MVLLLLSSDCQIQTSRRFTNGLTPLFWEVAAVSFGLADVSHRETVNV